MHFTRVVYVLMIWCFSAVPIYADIPCKAKPISGKSVVCVCNATYCDTITRSPPPIGGYVTYTSSKGGLRFQKSSNKLKPADNSVNASGITLELDPDTMYQQIQGFGGAVTDAAAINWRNLSTTLQDSLIKSYFGDEGLQYNMIRVPIGGTDFSTHPYAYNDLPENDMELSNFTLTLEDLYCKIPMIKAAMKASSSKIHVIASTWSPPPWMKTNKVYAGMSRLRPEYYQTYADYHYKFIDNYAAEGVPIWAITTTNEPTNGLIGYGGNINCVGWTANQMGKWIVNNLGPTIKNSIYKSVKILAGDDQRLSLPYLINMMLEEHPKALDYIDGIAVHFYTDFITPSAILTELATKYPGKFIIGTEACQGTFWLEKHHVDFGSWKRAQSYILDIINDLNHQMVGWMDWNLCLNSRGGPTWAANYADSPIIVFPERNAFVKQPMFYAMGHFSKFVPRGSRRIKLDIKGSTWCSHVSSVAFLTPINNIVVVLYNNGKSSTVTIRLRDKQAVVHMEEYSINTVEFYNG